MGTDLRVPLKSGAALLCFLGTVQLAHAADTPDAPKPIKVAAVTAPALAPIARRLAAPSKTAAAYTRVAGSSKTGETGFRTMLRWKASIKPRQ